MKHKTPTMAQSYELMSFVTKFSNLWQAGGKARLSLKCEAGQASVNLYLQIDLQHQHPPGGGPGQHYQQPRRQGPSRLLRR